MKADKKYSLIPYMIVDDDIRMLFVAEEGTEPRWEIASGELFENAHEGEEKLYEATGQLGLFLGSIDEPVDLGNFGNNDIFVAKMIDVTGFGLPAEGKMVGWLSEKEFRSLGRPSQYHIIQQIKTEIEKIESKNEDSDTN